MDIFNHKDYEKLWYDRWVEKGSFKAEVGSKKVSLLYFLKVFSRSPTERSPT